MITLKVKTNERFYREMAYKDSDSVAIDITGYSIDLDIKSRDAVVLANLSVGSGITITTAASGLFTVEVTDTSAWLVGTAKADIVLTDSSGDISASETFNISVIKGITSV